MTDKITTDKKVLAKLSNPTTIKEVRELNLFERLREVNDTAWTSGTGVAAIQIGIPLRYAWFRYKGREYELINPEITMRRGKVTVKEGCLSIPKFWTMIERAFEIEYISDGKKHKAKGFKAQIIQHEIDHMNGVFLCEDKSKLNLSDIS